MPKITYIGSVCVTVVSSTLGPDTSVPSDTAARLVMPLIGASTRVYVKIELRLVDARVRAFHFGFRDLLGRSRVVELLLAHALGFEHRLQPRHVALRLLEPRLGDAEIGFGARERDLERRGIDREQRLAVLDRRAFPVIALQQDAGHARAHFDFAKARGLTDVFVAYRHIARLGGDYRHRCRRKAPTRRSARGLVTPGKQCHQHIDAK